MPESEVRACARAVCRRRLPSARFPAGSGAVPLSSWTRCLDGACLFAVGSSCLFLGANRWQLFDTHFCFVIYNFGPHKMCFSVTKSLLASHLGFSYNDSRVFLLLPL